MSETLDPMPNRTDHQVLADELVARARAEGVGLVGPGGLLSGFMKTVLELGLDTTQTVASDAPLPIGASRMGHLWDALCPAYDALGFDDAAGGDEVFRQLVLARIIEPTSKLDAARVLDEVGVAAASYPTVNRRLPAYLTRPTDQRKNKIN